MEDGPPVPTGDAGPILTQELGFDPIEGYGRTRFGIAYLVWRLRTSRVLDLRILAGG